MRAKLSDKAFGYILHKDNRSVGRPDYSLVMCSACDLAPVNGQPQQPFRLSDIVESARHKYSMRYIVRRDEAARTECRSCHKPLAPPKARLRARRTGWYVNEYETHRTYGGPEEGGWWYDRRWPVSSYGPMPRKAAVRYARRLDPSNLRFDLEDQPARLAPAQHYE